MGDNDRPREKFLLQGLKFNLNIWGKKFSNAYTLVSSRKRAIPGSGYINTASREDNS